MIDLQSEPESNVMRGLTKNYCLFPCSFPPQPPGARKTLAVCKTEIPNQVPLTGYWWVYPRIHLQVKMTNHLMPGKYWQNAA